MSGVGGSNDFVEEKCAPIRRGGPPKHPPPVFSMELRPKFPKQEEVMPVEQQPQVPPQTPNVEASPVIKTVDQEGDAAPVGEVDSGNQEVSKDVDTPDNFEPRKKVKKKSKKPTKKKDETGAMAVFMEDDEPPKNDGNNAIGQFIDEEEEKKEKTKKEEKKPVKLNVVEKEKDSNRDKEGKDKEKEKPKVKKQKQPRTESLRQKQKPGTTQSGRQRKMQASVRKTNKSSIPPPALPPPSAKSSLTQQAFAAPPAPPPKPPAPVMTPDQKAAKEKDRLAREPNEGFLKAMYARAKQKIAAMSKNPNYVPSETCISDDTLIATDTAIIKPEVTAVYGAASDYPKGVIPPKNDKSHPDKLFPGGRPYWMNRDEKPPQTKVIMMSMVDSYVKQKNLVLHDNPAKKGPFTPYCENFLALQRADSQHFSGGIVLSNTARNCFRMRSNKASESEALKPRKKSTVRRKPKPISIPPMCQVYNRKDQKKKPPFVNKPVTMGSVQKKRKNKKSSGSNSTIDKE